MEDRAQDNFTNRSEESMESVTRHPQQEIGSQKTAALTELLSSLHKPEVVAALRQMFKEEDQSNWKKPLHVVVSCFQGLRVRAIIILSWMKVILLFCCARLPQVFNMVSENWKEKDTQLSEVQRNLKAVNETHEKVQENVGEVEDEVHHCCLSYIDFFVKKLHIGGLDRERGLGPWSESSPPIQYEQV